MYILMLGCSCRGICTASASTPLRQLCMVRFTAVCMINILTALMPKKCVLVLVVAVIVKVRLSEKLMVASYWKLDSMQIYC